MSKASVLLNILYLFEYKYYRPHETHSVYSFTFSETCIQSYSFLDTSVTVLQLSKCIQKSVQKNLRKLGLLSTPWKFATIFKRCYRSFRFSKKVSGVYEETCITVFIWHWKWNNQERSQFRSMWKSQHVWDDSFGFCKNMVRIFNCTWFSNRKYEINNCREAFRSNRSE